MTKPFHACGHRVNPDKPRQCATCRADGVRRYRALVPLTDEERRRSNARAYAKVYVRRGKLTKKPCEVCGDPNVEIHIEDYDKPLEVRWLCRPHRLALRKSIKG